jgi:hypothetical protein
LRAVTEKFCGKNPDAISAALLTEPSFQSAATVHELADVAVKDANLLAAVNVEIDRQIAAVRAGDLGRAESMLVAQAHALDTIFGRFARRAERAEYMPTCETYMRMALKAQNQCRATLETLALIKNPMPVAFVRQANIGQAVQVNNAAQPPEVSSRARGREIKANKLLEVNGGQRVVQSAAGSSSKPYSTVEAVGAVNGPKNRSG